MAKKHNQFEDLDSFSSKAEYNRTKKAKKGRHKGLRIFLSIICIFLIVIGAGMLYVSDYLLAGLTTTSITKDRDALGIVSGVQSDPRITNFALFGVDSRDNNFRGLSDVIMIVSIDEVHNKVKLTSVLRDSRVYMWEGYPNTDTDWDKINAAYEYGGPELAVRVLNQNFKMDITDYATVNFGKTAQIVDAFGGVDIEISEAEMEQINKNLHDLYGEEGKASGITDDDYLDSYGLQHLTGNAAVAYARIRYIDSDTFRANRQQNVLEALSGKMGDISIMEFPTLVRQLCNLCETSLDTKKLIGFASFALSDFSMERLIVPGDYENPDSGMDFENGAWMWSYDLDLAAEHIHSFIYEEEAATRVTAEETTTEAATTEN